MLAGNVAALLSPVVLVAVFTLIFGLDKYDWKSMMEIRRGDDHDLADAAGMDLEDIPGGHNETTVEFDEEQRKLTRAGKISKTATIVMVRLIVPILRTNVQKVQLTSSFPDPRFSHPVADAHVRKRLHL